MMQSKSFVLCLGVLLGVAMWVGADDVRFDMKGRIPGVKRGSMHVTWKGQQREVDDLGEKEKTELWTQLTAEQKQQLYDAYSTLTLQRERDWGKDLYRRQNAYYNAHSVYAELGKKWYDNQMAWLVPQDAINTVNDADLFLDVHRKDLTDAQLRAIERHKQEVRDLGTFIASLKVHAKRTRIQGMSKLTIGIVTDYCMGFATQGAKAVSDLVATVASQCITVFRGDGVRDMSLNDQLRVLDMEIRKLEKQMVKMCEKRKEEWETYKDGEPPSDGLAWESTGTQGKNRAEIWAELIEGIKKILREANKMPAINSGE